jgi:hypothetical protein
METGQFKFKFEKTSLLSKLLDISTNPYKIAFSDKVVEITKEFLINKLCSIKEVLDSYKSILVDDFLSTSDISMLLGDGHIDAVHCKRHLQETLINGIQTLLRQELHPISVKVRVDLSVGTLFINRI